VCHAFGAIAVLPVLLLATLAQASPAPAGRVAARQAALCFGTLAVVPRRVHIGGSFTLTGAHFACKTPLGKLFPSATILLYQPAYGFAPLTVHVRANGTYTYRARVPRTLIAASSLSGGQEETVTTRPGRYYFTIRLFDVDLPPPAQANGQITILR
jgi:hypothetical protein